jgi:hypothetical protein
MSIKLRQIYLHQLIKITCSFIYQIPLFHEKVSFGYSLFVRPIDLRRGLPPQFQRPTQLTEVQSINY